MLVPLAVFPAILLALTHPQVGFVLACLTFSWLLLGLYEWL